MTAFLAEQGLKPGEGNKPLGMEIEGEVFTQLASGKKWYWNDALKLHHQMNGEGKSKADINHIERPIKRLLAVLGDKALSEHTREDANSFRD